MTDEIAADLASVARIRSVEKILEVVCRTTGMGFSAVARVTETQWVACAVRDEIAFGLLPGGELPIETTICDSIRDCGKAVVIENVPADSEYVSHRTPQLYGFQSYASFPILLPDRTFFGTLCAIDPRPAQLKTPAITAMFTMFADLIGMQIDLLNRTAQSEANLGQERENSQLREQFIAVLGHDLRTPLGAIQSGVELLRLSELSQDDVETVDLIDRSVGRMSALIRDVLDFARGRLGGGLSFSTAVVTDLQEVLDHVVEELQAQSPQRRIEKKIEIDRDVTCDSGRIAQMLSNLIGNAVVHGDPTSPIWVRAETSETEFEISVTNLGGTIPADTVVRLFQPFVRGSARKKQEGLGLGLYIASEIARGHRGTLQVVSESGKTCFTFRMPLSGEPSGSLAIASRK